MTELYPAESIYNLIPREEVKPTKPPRYTSVFKETIKKEAQQKIADHKTMGPAKTDVLSPDGYLLKHSKESKLPEKKPFKYPDDEKRRPPVPTRTDYPVMGIQTKKNFLHSNAAETIMAVPKMPQPIFVDTKKGDKHPLETSGLVPKYLKKKDYGKVPNYLVQKNEEIKQAQEEYDAYIKERLRQGAMKQLSDAEREDMLQGLKKNWEELHHEYQGLSVVIDTLPKKFHKEKLELEMKQLEKDIDLIERHKIIYIANN
ncbi:enkurin [Protopterus annectens]|uniref:enkurin n=1 Tax=Protopterus annectens TaxID=7888 RepID=UPI001CFA67FA|nr:enkurin [Protopterus annectens]